MEGFEVRGIEIHSSRAWDSGHVSRVVDFAVEHELNALILHQNDIVDRAIYPGRFVGARASLANNYARYADAFRELQEYAPLRRDRPCRVSSYLASVVERASDAGLRVYLENKELSFPDMLVATRPELHKDGILCASDPLWFEYTREKYGELTAEAPGIAGVIVALSNNARVPAANCSI